MTNLLLRALRPLTLALLPIGAAACGAPDGAPDPVTTLGAPVVDSILPIEEELRRFRAGLGDAPSALVGFPDRETLVRSFVAAVEGADTAALAALPLTRAEFAYLYYPHTRFTAPPYELAPDILWFQIQNEQGRGLGRLLRRFAGAPLGFLGHRCEETPAVEGPNRVWDECALLLEGEAGDTVAVRLFGSVVERDGAFRLVSLANEL